MGLVYGAHLHLQATEDFQANGWGGTVLTSFYPPFRRTPGMAVDDEKQELRRKAKAGRPDLAAGAGPQAGERLADNFFKATHGFPGPVHAVSGYWPMADEIDVRPLMARLQDQGRTVALPVVAGAKEPLVFRRWQQETPLEEGPFGTLHPGPDQPEVTPGVLLVPSLAFDDKGFRLGWGGGYYDRTLARLRAAGPVIAVGAAFAGQQVDNVPHTSDDQPLDWIVTEESIVELG